MIAQSPDLSTVSVDVAGDGDAAAWDAFVHAHPEGTFCHLWEWRELFGECFGHRAHYLVARDAAGRIEGVLPLVWMRSLLGRFLISIPYLNYGGPLGTPRAQTALARRAREEAERGGARRLELRTRGSDTTGLPPARRKITVVLPLPESIEALWNSTFRAKLRSQIRRAQREKMDVRFGAQEEEAFYRVFSRNMRDLGTPVHPRAFFSALGRRFSDRVIFGAVYADGMPVAAGCGFVWRDEYEMTWASSLREHNAKAPNMLLYASFMEEMIRRGMRKFNFGRCTPEGGTHRFKLQWGGVDEPMHWAGWPDAEEREGTDEPGGVYSLASRAWRRLPVPVAETLGPLLAARLPQF